MEILIAKQAGFCEGVERAYKIALGQINAGKPVFMLGNLVHNAQVVKQFKDAGVKTVSSLSEIPGNSKGTLIISAHGVPPEIYAEAKKMGLEIIDTTCHWVKKAQSIAKAFADEGRQVLIVGDKGHAEVKGLLGWCENKGIVIDSAADIEKLVFPSAEKIGVLAQTTQSEKHFKAIVSELKKRFSNVKENDTICKATLKRQDAAVELAGKVDLMLVIGDKMSANTKRLTELCSKAGAETYQIQAAGELDLNWLNGKNKIGVTAGASTPDWVIDEVIKKLKKVNG